ncbi:hypothetical protein CYMTET_15454, partial [Cymbomonas tetramitiformis]
SGKSNTLIPSTDAAASPSPASQQAHDLFNTYFHTEKVAEGLAGALTKSAPNAKLDVMFRLGDPRSADSSHSHTSVKSFQSEGKPNGWRRDAYVLDKVVAKMLGDVSEGGLGLAGGKSVHVEQPPVEATSAPEPEGLGFLKLREEEKRDHFTPLLSDSPSLAEDPVLQAEYAQASFGLMLDELAAQLGAVCPAHGRIVRNVNVAMANFYHKMAERALHDRKYAEQRLEEAEKERAAQQVIMEKLNTVSRRMNVDMVKGLQGREADRVMIGASRPPPRRLGLRPSSVQAYAATWPLPNSSCKPIGRLICAWMGDRHPGDISDLVTLAYVMHAGTTSNSAVLHRDWCGGAQEGEGAGMGHDGGVVTAEMDTSRTVDTVTSMSSASTVLPSHVMIYGQKQENLAMKKLCLIGAKSQADAELVDPLAENTSIEGEQELAREQELFTERIQAIKEAMATPHTENRLMKELFKAQKENSSLKEDKQKLIVEVVSLQDMLRRARSILVHTKTEKPPVAKGETAEILNQAIKSLKMVQGSQTEEQQLDPRNRKHIEFVNSVLKAAEQACGAGEMGGGLAFRKEFHSSLEAQMSAWLLSLASVVAREKEQEEKHGKKPTARSHALGDAQNTLGRVIKRWQHTMLSISLSFWRNMVKGLKKKRQVLGRFFKKMLEKRTSPQHCFEIWMHITRQAKTGNEMQSIKQDTKKQRARIVELEELVKVNANDVNRLEQELGRCKQELRVANEALVENVAAKDAETKLVNLQKLLMPCAQIALALGDAAIMSCSRNLQNMRLLADATQMCEAFGLDLFNYKDTITIQLCGMRAAARGRDSADMNSLKARDEDLEGDAVDDDNLFRQRVQRVETMRPDHMLMHWANLHLKMYSMEHAEKKSDDISLKNFDTDLADGKKFAQMLTSIQPSAVTGTPELHNTLDPIRRVQLVFEAASKLKRPVKSIQMSSALKASTIPEESSVVSEYNAAFLAQLFTSNPGLHQRGQTQEVLEKMTDAIESVSTAWQRRLRPWLEVLTQFQSVDEERLVFDDVSQKLVDTLPEGSEMQKRVRVKAESLAKARRDLASAKAPQEAEYLQYAHECVENAAVLSNLSVVAAAASDKVQVGVELYNKIQARVYEFGWETLQAKLESREIALTNINLEKEFASITNVDACQIDDLIRGEGLEGDAVNYELHAIHGVLSNNFQMLLQVFKYYAAGAAGSDTSSLTMSSAEFWKFVKDLKLCDRAPKLPFVMVDLIFQICNLDKSDPKNALLCQSANQTVKDGSKDEKKKRVSGEDSTEDVSATLEELAPMPAMPQRIVDINANNPDRELVAYEFSESLVRLAAVKYKGKSDSLSGRLTLLIEKDIMKYAVRVDSDPFRKSMQAPEVEKVLATHSKSLQKIFAYYAGADKGDTKGSTSINAQEFIKLVKDCQLLDNALTEAQIMSIFAYIQHDELDGAGMAEQTAALSSPTGLTGPVDASSMLYPLPRV